MKMRVLQDFGLVNIKKGMVGDVVETNVNPYNEKFNFYLLDFGNEQIWLPYATYNDNAYLVPCLEEVVSNEVNEVNEKPKMKRITVTIELELHGADYAQDWIIPSITEQLQKGESLIKYDVKVDS